MIETLAEARDNGWKITARCDLCRAAKSVRNSKQVLGAKTVQNDISVAA